MDKVINVAISVTLFEMMVAIGLGITWKEIANVIRRAGFVASAALANYFVVPAVTVVLLLIFQAQPMVAAGFLLIAVCPGAPYGPPFTSIGKGNVPAAVGLMVVLAGSSAILAPLLLALLLPFVLKGTQLNVDGPKMVATLLLTQLLPLVLGLVVRALRPSLAMRFLKPANRLSALLNIVVLGAILVLQYKTLLQIPARGFVGMMLLVLISFAVGWMVGGSATPDRKALGLTTSTRNAAVALVIATASFPGTTAVTAVLAYAVFQTLIVAMIAAGIARLHRPERGIAAAA